MDNVCNRCLFSIPSKVEMAEAQNIYYESCRHQKDPSVLHPVLK